MTPKTDLLDYHIEQGDSACRTCSADALIAQACLDGYQPLLTNDADFEVFKMIGGLNLLACD